MSHADERINYRVAAIFPQLPLYNRIRYKCEKYELINPIIQVTLTPNVGELVRAVQMPETAFTAEAAKLRGMNETTASASISGIDKDGVRQRVYAATNVLQVCTTEI